MLSQSPLLQSLFTHSKQLVFFIDANLKVHYLNPKTTTVLELAKATTGIELESIIDADSLKLYVKHSRTKAMSFNTPLLLISQKNKRKIHIEACATFFNDDAHNFTGYFINAKDVTVHNNKLEHIVKQNFKYNAIIESGTQHVFVYNNKCVITQFNKNLFNDVWYNYGYALQESKSNLKTWLPVIAPDYFEYILRKVDLSLKGIPQQFDIQFKVKDMIEWREIFLYPLESSNNKVIEVAAISHNISPRKKAEKQLKMQESKLSALLDSGTHHIYSIGPNGVINTYNTNFQEFCRRYLNIEIDNKTTNINTIYNIDEVKLLKHIRWAFKGIPQYFEISTVQNGTDIKYFEIYFTPIVDGEPEISEVSVLAINITENHINNAKLFNQAAKLNTIIETSSLIFFTLSNALELTSFNSRFEEQYIDFFNAKPILGVSVLDLNIEFPKENIAWIDDFIGFWQPYFETVLKGRNCSFEHHFISQRGVGYWFEIILAPIFDSENNVTEISVIGNLVNERKQIELKLVQSLQEKEVLLKEVHHRVKNNLQVISSLLNLQSDTVEDEKILAILKESQNRVKSMSFIHEILYQNNEFGVIPFEKYITCILHNLVDSYKSNDLKITVETNFEEVSIDLDTSIPCGLIVNELISNSMKHAFKGKKTGVISINCINYNNDIVLTIKDNGKGFPDRFDLGTSKTLGMQLVYALIEQIDGSIEIINKFGTQFEIKFKQKIINKT
jgi:two-component sensor histidine kinase/PAS domain-containing protein